MRVLVTGGAGFIGSHLTRRILSLGYRVVVVDDLSTGCVANVPSGAEFLSLDLAEPGFVNRLPGGPFDAVCHLAAQSSGEVSFDDPDRDFHVNAVSTLALSRWCLKRGIPRFLYASSMAVYGDVRDLPASEDSPLCPLSYYGVSKLASEQILRLAQREGLATTALRMFSVYGPGQNLENLRQGMVSIFLAYLIRQAPIPVKGSLDRFRDFVYIDDVVDAWVRALQREQVSRGSPAIYNLGSGQPTTVRRLLDLLIMSLGFTPGEYPVYQDGETPGDQFGVYADIRRLRQELGWEPRTRLEDGLQVMVDWARGPHAPMETRN